MKVGILADTHFNSIHVDYSALEQATLELNTRADFILHAGDLTDGLHVYPSQETEQETQDTNKVIERVREWFKSIEKPFYFISGNHDLSYMKSAGIDICTQITSNVPDNIVYLGHYAHDVELEGHKFRLLHPAGSSAYSISYPAQKYIRNLDLRKEALQWLILGHFHKGYYLRTQGINCLGVPSFMLANDFSIRRGLGEEIGYDILTFKKKGTFSLQQRRF